MRSLKELLQIVLNEITKNNKLIIANNCLCFVVVDIWVSDIINSKEKHILIDYFINAARKSQYFKEHSIVYLFDPDDWVSRKKWLKQQINKL